MAQSSDFLIFFNHLIIHQILAKSSDFQPNHQIASCNRLQSSDHQMVQPSDDSIFIWMLWISLDGKHNDEWKIWWLKHLSPRTTVRPDKCQVSNCQTKLSEFFRTMDNCQTWQFWGRQLSDLTVVSGQLSELTVCEAQLMYHQSKMLTWQYIFVLDICCQHLGNICH